MILTRWLSDRLADGYSVKTLKKKEGRNSRNFMALLFRKILIFFCCEWTRTAAVRSRAKTNKSSIWFQKFRIFRNISSILTIWKTVQKFVVWFFRCCCWSVICKCPLCTNRPVCLPVCVIQQAISLDCNWFIKFLKSFFFQKKT